MILFGIRHKTLKLCCCPKKCNEIFGSWIYLVWQIISVNSYLVQQQIYLLVWRERYVAPDCSGKGFYCAHFLLQRSHTVLRLSLSASLPPLFLQKTPRSHSVKKTPILSFSKKNTPVSFCNNSYFFVHFPFLIQPIRHKNIGFSHSKEVFFSPF